MAQEGDQRVNDGGPAFPIPIAGLYDPHSGQAVYRSYEVAADCGGMSLRDWFAGQAMAAMVGTFWERHKRLPEVRAGGIVQTTVQMSPDDVCAEERAGDDNDVGTMDDAFAISAYRIADAMLAERAKRRAE